MFTLNKYIIFFCSVNCDKLTTIIESSLNVLEPAEYRKMFDRLSVFPPSAHIPTIVSEQCTLRHTSTNRYQLPVEQLLSLIWFDVIKSDVMVVVNKLHKYSLVEKQPKESTISIPSIYLELKVKLENEYALHRSIVDHYKYVPSPFLDILNFC